MVGDVAADAADRARTVQAATAHHDERRVESACGVEDQRTRAARLDPRLSGGEGEAPERFALACDPRVLVCMLPALRGVHEVQVGAAGGGEAPRELDEAV